MSRNPIDHQHADNGGRMKHFADVERDSGEEGTHPASKTLQQRAQQRGDKNKRAEEFTRIERGRDV
ncbi:hypothetical protein [Acidimangrovimonas pyrenivorans]|uniref:Stress-induced acidophilic repeat motif-containing protein n=1 Tax=Acidimangrovimonas pyrenivorans TaxID=2030798 RepID=A0ABV7ADB1_9RHOB